MSGTALPTAGEQIEIATSDDRAYTTWIDQIDGQYLSVFAPHDVLVEDVPGAGSSVSVRWHSVRGRHHVDAVFLGRFGDGGLQWELELESEPRISQDREYVRGAGGEAATVRRLAPTTTPADPDRVDGTDPVPGDAAVDGEAVAGVVVDLSERGVRVRLTQIDVATDDEVHVEVGLDQGVLSVTGTVLRIFPATPGTPPEVVVVYDTDEATATAVRRYVLQCQLRARQLAAR